MISNKDKITTNKGKIIINLVKMIKKGKIITGKWKMSTNKENEPYKGTMSTQ